MSSSFDPREFIARASWRFASTVPEKPHWYIVEGVEQDPDFRRFAELIEKHGYVAKFEGTRYRYVRIDGFVYWTSRSLWTPGQNINRRPVADLGAEHEQTVLPVVEGR